MGWRWQGSSRSAHSSTAASSTHCRKPGTWLVYAVVTDLVTVGATALAVSHGLTAVAWAFVAVALVATAARWVLVARQIGTPASHLARSFGAILLCAGGSAAAGLIVLAVMQGPLLLHAAAVGLVILVAHAILLRFTLPGTFADAISLGPIPDGVRSRLRRWARLPR